MSAVKRGCGSRVRGGMYVEAGEAGGDGPNILEFIADPMRAIDPVEIGVTPRGVHLIEMNGVNHVVDIVGSTHYPSPVFFVEEMIRHGVSRRIPKTFPFEKLDPARSKLILLHRRAFVTGHDVEEVTCPLNRHPNGTPDCSGAWWITVPKGHTMAIANGESFTAREESGAETFAYGILAVLPIERVGGIYDPEGDGSLESNMNRVSKCGFRTVMEEM